MMVSSFLRTLFFNLQHYLQVKVNIAQRGETMKYKQPDPHPLKAVIRSNYITLWQLRNMLGNQKGIDAPKLSGLLNGVEPMPKDIEKQIQDIIK